MIVFFKYEWTLRYKHRSKSRALQMYIHQKEQNNLGTHIINSIMHLCAEIELLTHCSSFQNTRFFQWPIKFVINVRK